MAINQQTGEAKTALRVWTVANLLTVLRILMILPFLYFVYAQRFGVALAVFLCCEHYRLRGRLHRPQFQPEDETRTGARPAGG